jgi:hypothetical protein
MCIFTYNKLTKDIMSEAQLNQTILNRVKVMLTDKDIMKEYQSKGSEKEAKEWIWNNAVFTLMYSPKEREELMQKKLN